MVKMEESKDIKQEASYKAFKDSFTLISRETWSSHASSLEITQNQSGDVTVAFITPDNKRYEDSRFDRETLIALRCWLEELLNETGETK